MNASVAKLSDGGKVCRACFKKITKVNPSINIKRYSLADIKDILQGKEIQSPKINKIQNSNIDEIEKPKSGSFILVLLKIVAILLLLYYALRGLFF
jgi:hypothetical protein